MLETPWKYEVEIYEPSNYRNYRNISGDARVWQFGFGYGAGWFSCIALFASVTLLICDRESEEIFYKERPVEEDEEAGGED